MADIDPTAVMAAHWCEQWVSAVGYCVKCSRPGEVVKWPCLPYRLAEALVAEQAKVARVEVVLGPETYRNEFRVVRVGDVRAALADQPEQEHKPTRCSGTLGSRPSWMSEGQYDPCRCKRPAGHDGDHACEHTDPSLALADQPEQEADRA